jgi:Fic family protein
MRTRYLDLDDRTQDLNERMLEDPDLASDFLQKYELSWVYHENALEGLIYTVHELVAGLASPQPVADATVIGVLQEVRNHKAAIDLVRSEAARKQPKVTLTLVKKIHETLHANIQSKGPSEFRKDMPLHRAYFHEIAQPPRIAAMLAKVVDGTDTADFRKSHPVQQAARIQHGFMQAYPYTDGSGKVARLLANLYLIRGGFLPCVIHSIDRQRYYDSFKAPELVLRDLMLEAMDNALGHAEKHFAEAPPARARRSAAR